MTPTRLVLKGPARQSGAVLITSMIFLFVLTLFVLAMVRGGSLEERLARNARDQQRALEAAEAVLRDAEASLFRSAPFDPFDASQFDSACTQGRCYRPDSGKAWNTIDWSSDSLTRSFASTSSHITDLETQPRYIVEILTMPVKTSSAAQCEHGLVKITARGDGNGGATAFVQSTVRFRVFSNICS